MLPPEPPLVGHRHESGEREAGPAALPRRDEPAIGGGEGLVLRLEPTHRVVDPDRHDDRLGIGRRHDSMREVDDLVDLRARDAGRQDGHAAQPIELHEFDDTVADDHRLHRPLAQVGEGGDGPCLRVGRDEDVSLEGGKPDRQPASAHQRRHEKGDGRDSAER